MYAAFTDRLMGYTQGTLNTAKNGISGQTAAESWSLDSEGNRYSESGVYATTYNEASESQPVGNYSKAGTETTVTFDSSRSDIVTYDAWGRVVKIECLPYDVGGPNGSTWLVVDSYDALGRLITTNNYTSVAHGTSTGTHTYYDGTNPVEVRQIDNATLLMTYIWSPADGRMILRDAVAAQLGAVHRPEDYRQQRERQHNPAALSDERRAGQHRGRCRSHRDRAGAVHL